MFAFFADMKAAFDKIKRGGIWRMMNRAAVDKKIEEGIRKI